MINFRWILRLIIILSVVYSCTRENLPVLTTTQVLEITPISAAGGGTLIDDGGKEVSSYGVCWNTSPNPKITDNKTTDGTVKGTYTSIMTGLLPNTTYYVRAYARNKAGIGYGEQIQFVTPSDLSGQTENVSDYEGNAYFAIGIGNQIWMKENLRSTKLNDGTSIPLVIDNSEWANTVSPAYCLYNNNEAEYKTTYGILYNGYTINTGKLCPVGWHVPTDAEWHLLILYLGGHPGFYSDYIESMSAGGKMKETGTDHWKSPNKGATNESGFTALPSGERGTSGTFYEININAFWWSSSEDVKGKTYYRYVNHDDPEVCRGPGFKQAGLSVRCLKDN